jgi:acetyltransferase-like isoleucine patch superfamily enzyme
MERGCISATDHAFADGPVFPLVADLAEARAALEKACPDPSDQDVRVLLAISEKFRRGANCHPDLKIGLGARLINGGDPGMVSIDGPTAVRGILRAEAGGTLTIGKFCYIGDGAIISARTGISIGTSTLIAHGVQIFDNNSHPTQVFEREVQFRRMLGDKSVVAPMTIDAAPVTIGERCWVGLNSLVLKGVTIGDDTIIAAASVVTSDLPAGVIAGGSPARILRELTSAERARSEHTKPA